jgi:hypothetical protein
MDADFQKTDVFLHYWGTINQYRQCEGGLANNTQSRKQWTHSKGGSFVFGNNEAIKKQQPNNSEIIAQTPEIGYPLKDTNKREKNGGPIKLFYI